MVPEALGGCYCPQVSPETRLLLWAVPWGPGLAGRGRAGLSSPSALQASARLPATHFTVRGCLVFSLTPPGPGPGGPDAPESSEERAQWSGRDKTWLPPSAAAPTAGGPSAQEGLPVRLCQRGP